MTALVCTVAVYSSSGWWKSCLWYCIALSARCIWRDGRLEKLVRDVAILVMCNSRLTVDNTVMEALLVVYARHWHAMRSTLSRRELGFLPWVQTRIIMTQAAHVVADFADGT